MSLLNVNVNTQGIKSLLFEEGNHDKIYFLMLSLVWLHNLIFILIMEQSDAWFTYAIVSSLIGERYEQIFLKKCIIHKLKLFYNSFLLL